MANEGKVSASLQYKSGTKELPVRQKTIEFDVTGTQFSEIVQTITYSDATTDEAITMPTDINVGGYVYIENLDTTNFVSIRQDDNAANFMKIGAGEFALFRFHPDTTTPFALPDTASVDILVRMLDL